MHGYFRRLFFLVFSLLPVAVNSQPIIADTLTGKSLGFIPKKFDYHLSLGTQFSTTSGYGSGLTTYITPSVNYTINKRFRIGGGIRITNTNLFNAKPFFISESFPAYNGNFSTATIFMNGQYLLSSRLTLYGSAYKEFPISGNPLPNTLFYPVSRNGAQGIQMNIDYKIGKNFRLEAGFGYSQGASLFYEPFGSFIGSSPVANPYHW